MEMIAEEGIIDSGVQRDEMTLMHSVGVTNQDGGNLRIEPAEKGAGLRIELSLWNLGPIKARFDPEVGLGPDELRARVAKSVTGFIKGPVEDSLYHALGDIIGDLAGIGRIDDAKITAKFMRRYHQLTMNAVKTMKLVKSV
jgi:hypothetical protein